VIGSCLVLEGFVLFSFLEDFCVQWLLELRYDYAMLFFKWKQISKMEEELN